MKRILIIIIIMFIVGLTFSSTAIPQQKDTKQQKAIKAQLYSVEAQLRFWNNQEKSKGKVAEINQLSQAIGKNVRRLWQEKLDLQETAAGLSVNIPQEPKRKGKAAKEDNEE